MVITVPTVTWGAREEILVDNVMVIDGRSQAPVEEQEAFQKTLKTLMGASEKE